MMTRLLACFGIGQQEKDIPHLPSEIIFNILIWLPAEFLHNIGKSVCKTWDSIICDPFFIKAHLHHSKAGLFFKIYTKRFTIQYLEDKKGNIEVANPDFFFPDAEPLASCEGISLISHEKSLYVVNCVTKRGLKLPCHHNAKCGLHYQGEYSLLRIPHSGDLKVVLACWDFSDFYHWHVLTVGTNMSWRKVEAELPLKMLLARWISINGVIYHCAYRRGYIYSCLAIDICDETTNWFNLPEKFLTDEGLRNCGFLRYCEYFSCILHRKNQKEMHVWILKDIASSLWVKIHTIEYNAKLSVPIWELDNVPIAWLDIGHLLALRYRDCQGFVKLAVYNLKTGKLKPFNKDELLYTEVLEHTKSLVSF